MTDKPLSDHELFEKIRLLSLEERKITSEVLRLLKEVAQRRLYAKYGYDSLFTFLVKELGYDEATAYRRVSAIRVIESVPEVEQALKTGTLTIATVAQAQTFFQQEKRRSTPCSTEKKREVLKKLEGKSKREAERILAGETPQATKPDQARVINVSLTEIRFTADQELLEMLSQIQLLTSHKNLEPGYNGLLKFMAAEVLKKLDPAKQKVPRPLSPVKVARQHASAVPSRHVPVALKRQIWNRDHGRCTYVSPVTGKRCDSAHGLQFDHIYAWAKGGETSAENLRLLCGSHNRFTAIETYGEGKMRPFLLRRK